MNWRRAVGERERAGETSRRRERERESRPAVPSVGCLSGAEQGESGLAAAANARTEEEDEDESSRHSFAPATADGGGPVRGLCAKAERRGEKKRERERPPVPMNIYAVLKALCGRSGFRPGVQDGG